MDHPLLLPMLEAAEGRFPPVDGAVRFVEPLTNGMEAVVGFTGHAVIATRLEADDFTDLSLDGFGSALQPETLLRLAGSGSVHSNDLTLVAPGAGPGLASGSGSDSDVLPKTDRWDDHPRVQFARSIRSNVVVHGDETGFATIATGLAGRTEIGVELVAEVQGTGAGRALIAKARRLLNPDQWLFAAVAPGNARSLRSFLSQGFVPIGTEVLIEPGPLST